MNPFDILMVLINGVGWGIKPITEKTEMSWWERRLREFGFDPKGLA